LAGRTRAAILVAVLAHLQAEQAKGLLDLDAGFQDFEVNERAHGEPPFLHSF
jgi:hypothetical protein